MFEIQTEIVDQEKDKKSNSNIRLWITFFSIGIILTIGAGIIIPYLQPRQQLYIIGGIIGIFLSTLMYFQPSLGAYLLIFTTFSNISDLFTETGLPSINQPLVAILFLVVIANMIFTPERLTPIKNFSKIEWTLVAYLLIIIFSYTVAIDKNEAIDSIIGLVKDITIVFIIFVTLSNRNKIKTGIWIIIITICILSILGIIKSFFNLDFTFFGLAQQSDIGQRFASGELRFGGPIGLANVWGQVLVIVLPYFIYRVVGSKNNSPSEVMMILATLSVIIAILLTGSRGAFIGFIIIFPLILLELRIKFPAFLITLLVGFFIFINLPSNLSQRFYSFVKLQSDSKESITSDTSVQNRLEQMQIGLKMFKDHPFLGVGIGNYSQNYWNYAEELGYESGVTDIRYSRNDREPHSLYIEILAETGLFGLSTFSLFLWFLIHKALNLILIFSKNTQDQKWKSWLAPILFSLISYTITGFFLHGIGFRWFWIISAISMAAIHLSDKKYQNIE